MDKNKGIIIKKYPEDFVVIERIASSRKKEFKSNQSGRFCIFTLKKRGVDMLSAINTLSKAYKIKERAFSYSGTKDKNAISVQYCSVLGNVYDKRFSFGEKGDYIEVKRVGFCDRPISLGEHLGNEFIIRVRNISDEKYFQFRRENELSDNNNNNNDSNSDNDNNNCNKNYSKGVCKNVFWFPNYFDSQRFGIMCNNHLIGKMIILSRYEEAKELIKEQMKEKINPRLLTMSGIEFIKKLNPKHAMMYVHAYQSFIFNRAISSFVKDNFSCFILEYPFGELAFPIKNNYEEETSKECACLSNQGYAKSDVYCNDKINNVKVSLAGFGFENKGKINKYVSEEMAKEGISSRDFIIRQIPSLSAESQKRDFLIKVKNFSVKAYECDCKSEYNNRIIDNLDFKDKVKSENPNLKDKGDYDPISKENVCEVRFILGKGSYATIVIAGLFNQRPSFP
ncbi:MAG TPA: tRNA pseudouridine(13) synthase TruD [Candidatus Woesearchaeota archaeon]|nr:tRNA pseudouridine(13) synthase TruD [Candidatus Woesearchaeota archaeon]